MSTLKTDTISEKTTDNGVTIDTFKMKDGVLINANTVASGTIGASENEMVIGPVGVTGTVNVNGAYTLPTSDGSSGQVLKTDGNGVLSWVNQSGGGGGSGATVQRFKLTYNSSGNLDSTSDKSSLIDSISIDSATGGDCTITFDSSINYPPASIMVYGYDYTNNKYYAVPLETTMGLREIAGGGSSGSPTVFNGSSTIALKLRLRETETGASRGGFGTTTHAWIEFVVYD